LRKKYIFWFSFIFAAGMIVGIITLAQIARNFTVAELMDFFAVDAFRTRASVFSYFFNTLLRHLLVCVVVFVVCLWYPTSFATFPIMFFRGYHFGVNLTVVCALHGIGGMLTVIFIYLPIQLILNFVFINFASICAHNAVLRRRLRQKQEFGFLLLFAALFFVLCLAESLIVPTVLRRIILSV